MNKKIWNLVATGLCSAGSGDGFNRDYLSLKQQQEQQQEHIVFRSVLLKCI